MRQIEASILSPCLAYFGGGGAPSMPKQKQQKPTLPPPPPAAPAAPPPMPRVPDPVKPDPMPTASAIDNAQARDQAEQDARRRRGMRKTLIAGEANQAMAAPVSGQKTLLG